MTRTNTCMAKVIGLGDYVSTATGPTKCHNSSCCFIAPARDVWAMVLSMLERGSSTPMAVARDGATFWWQVAGKHPYQVHSGAACSSC